MSNAAAAPSILASIELAVAAGQPVVEVFAALGSTEAGLSSAEVAARIGRFGRNVLSSREVTAFGVFLRQLRNPLLILLLAAAGVSAATGDTTDAAIIAALVV